MSDLVHQLLQMCNVEFQVNPCCLVPRRRCHQIQGIVLNGLHQRNIFPAGTDYVNANHHEDDAQREEEDQGSMGVGRQLIAHETL